MPDAPPSSARQLIVRLPRTFGPALNDQLRNWDLLFPAEQRQVQAQLEWLSRLPREQFKQLFAPLLDIESKMELPQWDAATAGMGVRDVGLLARSPLYPQWRTEVENVFSRIDDGVAQTAAHTPLPRLLLCVLPAGIPLDAQPLWPELAKQGAWVPLAKPFGQILFPFASALAGRKLPAGVEDVEGTWIFECDTRLSPLAESTGATVLSWTALAAARREFLTRLNTISRTLNAVDRTNDELKRLDLSRLIEPPVGTRPRLREFVRAVMLSGNGSLVFNNSFVQWGASEALRRAQPQVLIACFGIRPKLKPFSSVVLFEDQTRSNPTPDADDPAGSAIDALELSEYVYLAAQRVSAYQGRLLTLMAACDLDRVLLLGARPAPEDLASLALRWLGA